MPNEKPSLQERIKELEDELQVYKESPYENAYLAAANTVNKYCDQLSTQNVNLFEPEDKQKFEMVHKFMTELDFYLSTMDKIRAKMNPEIAKAIDKKIKQEKIISKDISLML